MNIVERIESLARDNEINITPLENKLGFAHGTIRSWATRQPTASKILTVANYFDVSVDYLLGRTDDPHGFDACADDSIFQLRRAVSKMTVTDKKRMMDILKAGFEYAFEDDTNKDK